MKIEIEQIWEYEFKPTDTFRLLHAFKNIWENQGDEITLERRGNKIYAVRRSSGNGNSGNDYKCPEIEAIGRSIEEDFPSINRHKAAIPDGD